MTPPPRDVRTDTTTPHDRPWGYVLHAAGRDARGRRWTYRQAIPTGHVDAGGWSILGHLIAYCQRRLLGLAAGADPTAIAWYVTPWNGRLEPT